MTRLQRKRGRLELMTSQIERNPSTFKICAFGFGLTKMLLPTEKCQSLFGLCPTVMRKASLNVRFIVHDLLSHNLSKSLNLSVLQFAMTVFRNLSVLVAVAAGVLSLSDRVEVTSADKSRKFEIINESGKKLAVDWINPQTGETVTLSRDFSNGAKYTFDTFVNHTFVIHEPTTSPSCGSIDGDDCGVQFVTVTEDVNQIAVVKEGLVVDHKDTPSSSRFDETWAIKDCRQIAKDDLASGYQVQAVMNELASCLEAAATDLLKEKNDEIAFESKIRLDLSAMLENHTCADPLRETTPPKEVRSWTHEDQPGQEVTRNVFVLHDRPDSQIHALENFISEEECDAITEAAAKKLHRGTVADGAGGSRLSDHRKAWQAGIKIHWEKEKDGDLIARVMRRVYDYTNDAVHYNLTIEGQEDLMSIQYFGKGKDSMESPDQYRPHCDGDCDGLPHKTGGRVATMVMYCNAPELGGGTNFQNANVFVKPQVGAAAFFSYLNAETMYKDNGFTSHSGCPVIEGIKRIAVHWMRVGVDEENPWNSFNTLTIKRDEEDC